MKKLSILFLIVIMVFAFVSCSPDAGTSTDSAESNLLPGEVIPPSDGDLVSATDEEIEKLLSLLFMKDVTYDKDKVTVSKEKYEVDFGSDGKLTMEGDKTSSDTTINIKGQIKVNGITYKADNLVLVTTSSESGKDSTKIKSGSMTKDGKNMTADEITAFMKSLIKETFGVGRSDCAWTEEEMESYTVNILDGDSNKIGNGTVTNRATATRSNSKYKMEEINIVDYTINEDRLQMEMSGGGEFDFSSSATFKLDFDIDIDYIALNGKFFDEKSMKKIKEKLKEELDLQMQYIN